MDTIRNWWRGFGFVLKIANWAISFGMWLTKDMTAKIYHGGNPAPVIPHYVASASEIWLIVHNGDRAEADGLLRKESKVTRIIFPCPNHNLTVRQYAAAAGETYEEAREKISKRSKAAAYNGKIVRWTDDAVSQSMIFLNPEDHKSGLTLVDVYLPYMNTSPRPRLEVTAKNHEALFVELKQSFNAIFDRCHDQEELHKLNESAH